MKNKMKFTFNIVKGDFDPVNLVDFVGFEMGIVDFYLMYIFLFVS